MTESEPTFAELKTEIFSLADSLTPEGKIEFDMPTMMFLANIIKSISIEVGRAAPNSTIAGSEPTAPPETLITAELAGVLLDRVNNTIHDLIIGIRFSELLDEDSVDIFNDFTNAINLPQSRALTIGYLQESILLRLSETSLLFRIIQAWIVSPDQSSIAREMETILIEHQISLEEKHTFSAGIIELIGGVRKLLREISNTGGPVELIDPDPPSSTVN